MRSRAGPRGGQLDASLVLPSRTCRTRVLPAARQRGACPLPNSLSQAEVSFSRQCWCCRESSFRRRRLLAGDGEGGDGGAITNPLAVILSNLERNYSGPGASPTTVGGRWCRPGGCASTSLQESQKEGQGSCPRLALRHATAQACLSPGPAQLLHLAPTLGGPLNLHPAANTTTHATTPTTHTTTTTSHPPRSTSCPGSSCSSAPAPS